MSFKRNQRAKNEQPIRMKRKLQQIQRKHKPVIQENTSDTSGQGLLRLHYLISKWQSDAGFLNQLKRELEEKQRISRITIAILLIIATDRGHMETMKGNSLLYGFFSSIAAIYLTPCF